MTTVGPVNQNARIKRYSNVVWIYREKKRGGKQQSGGKNDDSNPLPDEFCSEKNALRRSL